MYKYIMLVTGVINIDTKTKYHYITDNHDTIIADSPNDIIFIPSLIFFSFSSTTPLIILVTKKPKNVIHCNCNKS